MQRGANRSLMTFDVTWKIIDHGELTFYSRFGEQTKWFHAYGLFTCKVKGGKKIKRKKNKQETGKRK